MSCGLYFNIIFLPEKEKCEHTQILTFYNETISYKFYAEWKKKKTNKIKIKIKTKPNNKKAIPRTSQHIFCDNVQH